MKRLGDVMRPKTAPRAAAPTVDSAQLAVQLGDLMKSAGPKGIPWQVPVLVELASNAKSQAERAAHLSRAISKMKAPR